MKKLHYIFYKKIYIFLIPQTNPNAQMYFLVFPVKVYSSSISFKSSNLFFFWTFFFFFFNFSLYKYTTFILNKQSTMFKYLELCNFIWFFVTFLQYFLIQIHNFVKFQFFTSQKCFVNFHFCTLPRMFTQF